MPGPNRLFMILIVFWVVVVVASVVVGVMGAPVIVDVLSKVAGVDVRILLKKVAIPEVMPPGEESLDSPNECRCSPIPGITVGIERW